MKNYYIIYYINRFGIYLEFGNSLNLNSQKQSLYSLGEFMQVSLWNERKYENYGFIKIMLVRIMRVMYHT